MSAECVRLKAPKMESTNVEIETLRQRGLKHGSDDDFRFQSLMYMNSGSLRPKGNPAFRSI